MKRKDVYSSIINCAEDELKKDCGLDDPNIMESVKRANSDEYNSSIDEAFDNVYKNSQSYFIDLAFITISGLVCFMFLPLQLIFQISIFLSINLVMQFIKNKGLYFMIKEIKNKFSSDVKCKIHYRPKTGKYTPIVIGKQKDVISVYSLESEKIGEMKNPRIYIADKEVLPVMIEKYKTKDSQCIRTVTKSLKDDIIKSYCLAERLWKESKEENTLYETPPAKTGLNNFGKDE